eukprot:TRINITY_DN840_c0_g1_i8.p3 TRINITY_DN840_c0_g1~~TRINITY_DN840_c0_g1_i8.p3  ORF type:complete len:108 (+),score=11.56 TRINITY_DN840_c0_g1_i8:637-960(+)
MLCTLFADRRSARMSTLRSFVEYDATCDFPIQNIPYGVFSTAANASPRIGVAIGASVLDLSVLLRHGLLSEAFSPYLNQVGLFLSFFLFPLVEPGGSFSIFLSSPRT